MYESPITQVISDISNQIVENQENHLMMEVRQKIGYDIDKDELIKALNHDRNQYEKGFNDGEQEVLEKLKYILNEMSFPVPTKDNMKVVRFIELSNFEKLFKTTKE